MLLICACPWPPAGQTAYLVTFGRAGEDNKKFKLGDVEQTLQGVPRAQTLQRTYRLVYYANSHTYKGILYYCIFYMAQVLLVPIMTFRTLWWSLQTRRPLREKSRVKCSMTMSCPARYRPAKPTLSISSVVAKEQSVACCSSVSNCLSWLILGQQLPGHSHLKGGQGLCILRQVSS